ncbi:MAG: OFA family MFS transporter [Pseudomonadota bacterium]
MSFLSRDRTIAGEGFNRLWAVLAALGIHIPIGQIYAFSVFKLPLTKLIGVTQSAPADWGQQDVGWIFSLGILFLGLTAAFAGKWVEKQGPRKAMCLSALCFGGGFLISALGIHLHILALMYIGYGVIGGMGLGFGYVAPVTMLMRWFPDRPGMATGLAIMGFGGGALVAAPLSTGLMDFYATGLSNGVFETFVTMGIVYLVVMMLSVVIVRIPAEGWQPLRIAGKSEKAGIAVKVGQDKTIEEAMKTPAFYFLWLVLCLNVTAGIGLIYQASPMVQEMFPNDVTVVIAAIFVSLISVGNMIGRFVWSAASDHLGRPLTFGIFFIFGAALYVSLNIFGASNYLYFMGACVLIISMYGGSFSTMPAYLKDVFGMKALTSIYGRVLTAWSVAGILGPKMFDMIREYQLANGATIVEAYAAIINVIIGLMVVGFVCNMLASRALKK